MNKAMLLSLLVQDAPRLLAALQGFDAGSYPNIENSIVDSTNLGDLETQFANSYNHISSDLVPESTNLDVALGNMDKELSITDPISTGMPNLPFMNGDMARQFEDDDMQRKVKLSSLYDILNKK